MDSMTTTADVWEEMVSEFTYHLVIGLGEIGRPLLRVINIFGDHIIAHGRDLEPKPQEWHYHVLHICFPWSEEFADHVLGYIGTYQPDLCIIHSTVVPGTTDKIAAKASCMIAYSPVRGRHGEMERDMVKYRKFVASPDDLGLPVAVQTLEACGFDVETMDIPAALELSKILATSYSALLIAWAQEMDRYAQLVGGEYWDVTRFLHEQPHLPKLIFQPGHIGGHCLIQNLDLLSEVMPSQFIGAIFNSNIRVPEVEGERLRPVPVSELGLSQGGCACQNHGCC